MRFFNTTGPVVARDHYCVPPLERFDLSEVLELIRQKRYFVLHAPRQTGKTSALLALQDLLNGGVEGEYRCVYANVEAAQAVREGLERTIGEGLAQTAAYMDRCGSPAGHLIIFDRRERKPWEEKIFRREESCDGRAITVWGM